MFFLSRTVEYFCCLGVGPLGRIYWTDFWVYGPFSRPGVMMIQNPCPPGVAVAKSAPSALENTSREAEWLQRCLRKKGGFKLVQSLWNDWHLLEEASLLEEMDFELRLRGVGWTHGHSNEVVPGAMPPWKESRLCHWTYWWPWHLNATWAPPSVASSQEVGQVQKPAQESSRRSSLALDKGHCSTGSSEGCSSLKSLSDHFSAVPWGPSSFFIVKLCHRKQLNSLKT